jgi:UDP-glucose 4-epimerase
MRILVTGGAGFIGSHLVDKLINSGHQVGVADDLSGGKKENLNPKAKFYQCDVRDWLKIDKVISRFEPKVIYHLAANAAENKAQFCPVDITSRNFDGAIKVLTAGIRHGLKRFIFTSSIAVYGKLQTPFKEINIPEPEDVYGATKLAFENCLKILAKVHGFEYVILRPHNVYGPRQNMSDPYRNVVTIFMNTLLKGQAYCIYGDGRQKRCFSYVEDVVAAMVKCLKTPVSGMIFNIGSDKAVSINELSGLVMKVSKLKIKPRYLSPRPQEVRTAVSDHGLSKKHLDYGDRTSLERGLALTWEWAQEQGYQTLKYTDMEITSNLVPVNWRKRK